MARLISFIRRYSERFPLLFEFLLILAMPFFVLASSWARAPKKARARGPLGKWLHGRHVRILSSTIEVLDSRAEARYANQRWGRVLRRTLQLASGNFMMTGNLRLGAQSLEAALKLFQVASQQSVHDHRVLGATYFMMGEIGKAHRAFARAGYGRKLILKTRAASSRVRYLGPGWFVAIGHVSMLDFYFKQRLLGWNDAATQVLMARSLDSIPGHSLVLEYRQYGLRLVSPLEFGRAYDQCKDREEIAWSALSDDDRFAAMDDFWEYDFPDDETVTYTHAAARIQQQWEASGRAPLLSIGAEKRAVLDRVLREMGVPEGRWYACLHVREAGFHARWNTIYPTLRDADVEDYLPAVDTIVKRGGIVIRVGDPSMKKLPPMEGVYDYAHSDLKTPLADILVPAGCRFFVGTNSGYATVPGIYGVPNVLTNWVPIALPLWFSRDLMIPKLFRDLRTGDLVDYQTMFSTKLGCIQNVDDLPDHIELVSNTPEEINAVVAEMLDRLENNWAYTAEDNALQERYQNIAERSGSYRGSRLGRDFMRKYARLCHAGDEAPTTNAVELKDDNTPNRRAAVPISR